MTNPGNNIDNRSEFQSGADGLVRTLLRLTDTVVVVSDGIRDGFRLQPELPTDAIHLMDSADQGLSFAIGSAMTGHRTSVVLDTDIFFGVREQLRSAHLRHLPLTVIIARNGGAGFDPIEEFGDLGCPVLGASDGQALMDLSVVANAIAKASLLPALVVTRSNQSLWTYGQLVESPGLDAVEVGDKLGFYRSEILKGDENPAWIDTANPMASGTAIGGVIATKQSVGRKVFIESELPVLVDQLLKAFSSKSGRMYDAVHSDSSQPTDKSLVVAGTLGGQTGSGAGPQKVKKSGMSTIHVTRIRPFPTERLRRLLSDTHVIGVLQEAGISQHEVTRFCCDVRSALTGLETKENRTLWKRSNADDKTGPVVVPIVHPAGWIPRSNDVAAIDRYLSSSEIGEMAVAGVKLSGDDIRLPAVEEMVQRLSRHGVSFSDYELRSEDGSAPDSDILIIAESAQTMWPLMQGACKLLATGTADNVKGSLHPSSSPSTFPVVARITYDSDTACGPVIICPDPALLRTRLAREVIPVGSMVVTAAGIEDDGTATLKHADNQVDRHRPVSSWPYWMKEKRLDLRSIRTTDDTLTETDVLLGAFANVHPLLANISASQLESSKVFATSSAGSVKDLAERLVTLSSESFQSASERPPEAAPTSALLDDSSDLLPVANLLRFWKSTGHLHRSSQLSDAPVDAFLTSQYLPASTSALLGRGQLPSELPRIISERCTGCGGCWTVCPESAFVVRPFTVEGIWNASTELAKGAFVHLPRLSGAVIKTAHRLLKGDELHQYMTFGDLFTEAFERVLDKAGVDGEKRTAIESERDVFLDPIASIRPVRTDEWFVAREEANAGEGALLGIAIDTDACTVCGLCMQACNDEAIEMATGKNLEIEFQALDRLPELVGESNPSEYFDLSSAILTGRTGRRVFRAGGEDVANLNRTAVRLFLEAQCDYTRSIRSGIVDELTGLIARIDSRLQQTIDQTVKINDFDQLSSQLVEAGKELGEHLKDLFPRQTEDVTERLTRLSECRTVLVDEMTRLGSDPAHQSRPHAVVVDATRNRSLGLAPYPSNPFAMPYYKVRSEDVADLASGISNGLVDQYSKLSVQMRLARQTLDDVLEPGSSMQIQIEDRQWAESVLPHVSVITDKIDSSIVRALSSGRPLRVLVLRGPHSTVADIEDLDAAALAQLISNVWVSRSTVGDPALLLSEFSMGVANSGPVLFEVLAADPVRDNIQVDEALDIVRSKVTSGDFRTFRKEPGRSIEWSSENGSVDSTGTLDESEKIADAPQDQTPITDQPTESATDALKILTQKLLTLSGFDRSSDSLREWLEARTKTPQD